MTRMEGSCLDGSHESSTDLATEADTFYPVYNKNVAVLVKEL